MPRPSKFTYTSTQEEALERLVALGFCHPASRASQAQIELVWLHVPVEQSGGMGLGLDSDAVAAFVRKKAHTITDKHAGMARWRQWVADHNQDVPVPYTPESPRRFSVEDRKILQNLVTLGLCRNTVRAKIQVEHVWLEIPLEQLGGLGLKLAVNQVMGWVNNLYSHREKFIGDKEVSMAKWEKWVSDHNRLVPPYQYANGAWSRDDHTNSTGFPKPAPVGRNEHEDSDSPLTDLSDLDIDLISPVLSHRVSPKTQSQTALEPASRLPLLATRTPAKRKGKHDANENNEITPTTPGYHLRNRTARAGGKKICYKEDHTDSDDLAENKESSDDETTKPQPNFKATTNGERSKCAPQTPVWRGRKNVTDKNQTSTPTTAGYRYQLRNQTPRDQDRTDAGEVTQTMSMPDSAIGDATSAADIVHQGESLAPKLPVATPCPQSRVGREATEQIAISTPEFSGEQHAALETLVSHGLYTLTPRAVQQIRQVWSKVSQADGGGKGLNITRAQIQRYLIMTVNKLEGKDTDEKKDALIRWEQWIDKHRRRVRTARSQSTGGQPRSSAPPTLGASGTHDQGIPNQVLGRQSDDNMGDDDGPHGVGPGAERSLVFQCGLEIRKPWRVLPTAERVGLISLIDLGLCRTNLEAQSQVESVWKKIPVESGGGAGLALRWNRISSFIKSHAYAVLDTNRAMEKWGKWVEAHEAAAVESLSQNGRVLRGNRTAADTTLLGKGQEREGGSGIIQFPTPSYDKAGKYLSPAERGALERLMNHGLCRISKITEAQVENVWRKVPLQEGGGQELMISWKRISRFIKGYKDRVPDKDESMRRWDKWVEDHRRQARDGVTPPGEGCGGPSSKRRSYYDGESTDEPNASCGNEDSIVRRAKRFRTSATASHTSEQTTAFNSRRNSTIIYDSSILDPPEPILESDDQRLKTLYQPYLGLAQEQIDRLAQLVRLGGCWGTSRDHHLIEKIWLRVPQRFGGGLGLGVPVSIIKSFVRSRGGKMFRTEEGLTRWEKWIARNRSNVVVEESLPDIGNKYSGVDIEGDSIMSDSDVGHPSGQGAVIIADPFVDNTVAEGVDSAQGTELAIRDPAVVESLGNPENQVTQSEGAQGQAGNPPGGLVVHIGKTPNADDVFAITQDIVSCLNQLSPPAETAKQVGSLDAITQQMVPQVNRHLSPHGIWEDTRAQSAPHTTVYQPRRTYSAIHYGTSAFQVQDADERSVPSLALQVAPEVAPAEPQQSRGGCMSQATVHLPIRPFTQPTTTPRNPWLREDGSVRDWYWYPPGTPGAPAGRIFEHWTSAAVPLRQFDSQQTHEVTLTMGRDSRQIAGLLRELERWPVQQVVFHGYQL